MSLTDDLLAEIEGMTAQGAPLSGGRASPRPRGLADLLAAHFDAAQVIAARAAEGQVAADALSRWMTVAAVFATHLRSLVQVAEGDPGSAARWPIRQE